MEIRVSVDNNYPASGEFSNKDLDWTQYEAYVFGSLQRLLPGAKVLQNVRLIGTKTKRPRQVDILVERDLGGFDLRIAVDCKCYRRKVNVNDVERFLGMLDDIRVSKGVLMTTKGYSKTASHRVQNESRDIELRILTVERLSEFHSIGCALLWNGPVAALVSPPETWVVDNEHRPIAASMNPSDAPQFTLYPLGHTRDSAVFSSAFIYGRIVLKRSDAPTMEAMAGLHEQRVLEKYPLARFERLPPIEPETWSGREPAKTILRVGHIHAGYKGPEYSLYIDHPEGVLLLVLFCPEGEDEVYVPTLKWIGQKALLMNCDDRRPTRSEPDSRPASPK